VVNVFSGFFVRLANNWHLVLASLWNLYYIALEVIAFFKIISKNFKNSCLHPPLRSLFAASCLQLQNFGLSNRAERQNNRLIFAFETEHRPVWGLG
jgi:hypothetical protein